MLSIVLIDDQPAFLDILEMLIKESGVARVVGKFTDGAKALEEIASLAPDAITVDVSMPKMNGIEVTKKLHEVSTNPCVLAVSGYVDGVYVRGMIDAGARGYLMKDNLREELITAIQCITEGGQWYGRGLDDASMEYGCSSGESATG